MSLTLGTDSLTPGRSRGEGAWEEMQYGESPFAEEILRIRSELGVVYPGLKSYLQKSDGGRKFISSRPDKPIDQCGQLSEAPSQNRA